MIIPIYVLCQCVACMLCFSVVTDAKCISISHAQMLMHTVYMPITRCKTCLGRLYDTYWPYFFLVNQDFWSKNISLRLKKSCVGSYFVKKKNFFFEKFFKRLYVLKRVLVNTMVFYIH